MRIQKWWMALGCGAWLLVGSVAATALELSLVKLGPLSSEVLAPFQVAIDVSGLGDEAAPTLRAFTLELAFEDTEVDFLSVSFGTELGFPCPIGDTNPACLAQVSDSEAGGVVSLFENSLISPIGDLEAVQPDAFRLATLTFQGLIEVEGSPLSLIDDGDQELILGNLTEGVVNSQPSLVVNITPEPGTALLLGLGCAGLAVGQRRRAA